MSVARKLHGSYSNVMYISDEGVVMKRPLDSSRKEKAIWYNHQYRAMLFEQLGIHVPGIVIPKILSLDTNSLIETYQPGTPLTQGRFATLSTKDQQGLARRLARFLKTVHQIKTLPDRQILQVKFFKSSIYFKALCLPYSFLKNYRVHFNRLKNNKTLFHKVLCYRDLKAKHLLYDDQKKILSIIDFGAVDFDIPLKEFCLDNPLRSGLSLFFLKDVIKSYNRLSSNHAIDLSLVKSYLYCAA